MQIEIRTRNLEAEETLRSFIEQRLERSLRRFAPRIRRIRVYLGDINGPRGGIDKRIRAVLDLFPKGQIVVDGTSENSFAAAADVAHRLQRSVRRALQSRISRRLRRARNGAQYASGVMPQAPFNGPVDRSFPRGTRNGDAAEQLQHAVVE